MKENKYYSFLIKQNIIGFCDQPIKLKSGKESSLYANFRNINKTNQSLEILKHFVIDFISKNNIELSDGVLGVPEGATILGYEIQKKLIDDNLVLDSVFQYRIIPKTHGAVENRFWVNGNKPRKIILIEDVVTTGGSTLSFIKKLKEMDIETTSVITLLDREQLDISGKTAKDLFKEMKIKLYTLSTASDILPIILKTTKNENYKQKIKNEYETEYQKFNKQSPLDCL